MFVRRPAWIALIAAAIACAAWAVPAAQQAARPQNGDGAIPRLASGKPDFSGVWEHAYVPDMTVTGSRDGMPQKGAGPLPYTPAALENIKNYDPDKNGDYTGMCMPFGMTRAMNSPYPIQFMQNDRHFAILFEQNTWFHVARFRNEHSDDPSPTWFGESIARWDGDTLVVDTIGFNGFTRLDTRGNPHSDKLHLVQTFRHIDARRLHYVVTVTDPVYYTRPWANEREFVLSDGDLLEYSCEENNRSLWEGRIKLWTPPGSEPLRNPVLGAK